MEDMLYNRWNNTVVTGDEEAKKPGYIAFENAVEAVELLRKHILNNSRIAVHCDVDVDGIGSGFIVKSFLRSQGINNALFLINKDKVHGIQEDHIDFFNNKCKIDLLIIVDSSTNETSIIKQLNCDTIVIDHHDVQVSDLHCKSDHEYIVVNNMVEGTNNSINEWLRNLGCNTVENIDIYKADSRMSGALVLYELLRVYCAAYNTGNVLENMYLYQWVGVTLFSDAVILNTERNQWYIDRTVHNMEIEPSLKVMMQKLNKFQTNLGKSYIMYTFAPVINKAIRAGHSGEALNIVLNNPSNIESLVKYKQNQLEAIEKIPKDEVYVNDYIMKDITSYGISKNYCGVMASKLCGENAKNTAVYIVRDGIAYGSFRGRYEKTDYRNFFKEYSSDIYAQGHGPAFGFHVRLEQLSDIMSRIHEIETKGRERFYITAGNIPKDYMGIYHINSMDNFKKLGYFWRLAIANSKLSSQEELVIYASISDVKMLGNKGKLYKYEVLGIECKAFEIINTTIVKIYIEFNKTAEAYIRNYKV